MYDIEGYGRDCRAREGLTVVIVNLGGGYMKISQDILVTCTLYCVHVILELLKVYVRKYLQHFPFDFSSHHFSLNPIIIKPWVNHFSFPLVG